MKLDSEILNKYNVSGPRYTSYPAALEWKDEIDGHQYADHLEKVSLQPKAISLYIHIPFCQSLCHYCGCNVSIRKHWPKYGDEYIDYLKKEIDLVIKHLGKHKKVQQFHLGGGTPTFLNPAQMDRLLNICHSNFSIDQQGEIAIEIEPRTIGKEQIKQLKNLGFNRLSMGVQDFNENVQKAINREQSFESLEKVYEQCREIGFSKINMDFIYGLPLQTRKSFSKVINQIKQLNPNRLALYSFAHLPKTKLNHRKIKPEDLPSPQEKIAIFLDSREALTNGNYKAIGMDHFAQEDDEISLAYEKGKLNRNFMGYTCLPCDDFIGIGASSIGYVAGGYFQNSKNLPEYYQKLNRGQFPLQSGHILSREDLIRKDLIHRFMCQLKLNLKEFQEKHDINFETYFSKEKQHIQDCVEDGLLKSKDQNYLVTELGKLFIRNISMGFDPYLTQRGVRRYSSAV